MMVAGRRGDEDGREYVQVGRSVVHSSVASLLFVQFRS